MTGDLGKGMGLDNKWAYNIIKQVGNYGESFDRNVGMGSKLQLPRGLNALWTERRSDVLATRPLTERQPRPFLSGRRPCWPDHSHGGPPTGAPRPSATPPVAWWNDRRVRAVALPGRSSSAASCCSAPTSSPTR